jgi:hypothetical protein
MCRGYTYVFTGQNLRKFLRFNRTYGREATVIPNKLYLTEEKDVISPLCAFVASYHPQELVASFMNRLNLLKYGETTHACAASLPMERTRKRCGDHAPFVLRAATACPAFF